MKVNFFATFRQLTMEKSRENLSADTLDELLEKLCDHYGSKFRKEVFVNGNLSKDVMILVNGKAIEHLAGINTQLAADDEVSIFPRIAGG